MIAYSAVTLDPRHYQTETKTHTFWHPLFAGMVGASPELSKIFPDGKDQYSDSAVYFAVIADLRARNEVPPEVAFRHDGLITINAMRNMRIYERLVRRVFFDVVKDHPWFALKSFLYDKPRSQIAILDKVQLVSGRRALLAAPLTLAASLIAIAAGLRLPRRHEVRRALPVVVIVAACAWLPTLVVPSRLIVDSVLVYLVFVLLGVAYLPLVM